MPPTMDHTTRTKGVPLLFDGFTAFFKLDLCDLRSAALVLTPFAAVADTNIVAAILLLRVRKNKKKRGVI